MWRRDVEATDRSLRLDRLSSAPVSAYLGCRPHGGGIVILDVIGAVMFLIGSWFHVEPFADWLLFGGVMLLVVGAVL